MARPSAPTLSRRLLARLEDIEPELRKDIKAALPDAHPSTSGIVKGLRAWGRIEGTVQTRRLFRQHLVEAIDKALKEHLVNPQDLGSHTLEQLADRLVLMVERVGYHDYQLAALRNTQTAIGLKGNFRSELFELLVRNDTVLNQYLREMAGDQLATMNQIIAQRSRRLVDSRQRGVQFAGEFKTISRASSIVTFARGTKTPLKFVDFAYVSVAEFRDGRTRITFLVECEIKLPSAAGKFEEQINAAQRRFAEADRITMIIEGVPHEFAPDQIVFDFGRANRIAVTSTRLPATRYAIRTTEKDAYLRIGVPIKVDLLNSLVEPLFTFR
jgi:hypothetical protein